jgi:hypothetical protein
MTNQNIDKLKQEWYKLNNGPAKKPIKIIYDSKNLYISEDNDGNISIIDKTSIEKAVL